MSAPSRRGPAHLKGQGNVPPQMQGDARPQKRLVLIPVALVVATALFVWLVAFGQIKALVSLSAILGTTAQQKAAAGMAGHSAALSGTGVAYPRHGDMIGTLEAPAAQISVAVYQGDDYDILAQGAGHSFASALPGEGGKVVLSTHNNSFFSTLDQLAVGDEVTLELYYGTYRYAVAGTFVFDEGDTAQLADEGADKLFCYTCYPLHYLGSTPQRYAVVCTLVEGAGVTWQ